MSTPRALPRLKTPRLTLRIPAPEDAALMLDFQLSQRPHLDPWSPKRPDAFYTEGFWRERLAQHRQEFLDDRSMCLALVHGAGAQAQIVGEVNFRNFVRGAFQACHLGYALAAEFEGQGVMTEALQAALPHVFDTLRMHRVMANYMPRNERSGRLLRRLGFVVEGYARDYLYINGRWEDHVLTALLAPPRP